MPSNPKSSALNIRLITSPIAMPITVPMAISITKNETNSPKEVEGSVNSRISAIVSTTAIGSLLPDSNSSNWAKRFGSLELLDLSTMKIAAASVDDTIAPSKRPSRNENPWTQATNVPTSNAVMSTPIVERDSPFHNIGFTPVHSVSNPPENRIMMSAKIPSDFTRDGSSKYMPPGPSDPANMPMATNKTREGIPNRLESLIVRMLRTTRLEKTMRIHSRDVGIDSVCFEFVGRAQMRSIAQTTKPCPPQYEPQNSHRRQNMSDTGQLSLERGGETSTAQGDR